MLYSREIRDLNAAIGGWVQTGIRDWSAEDSVAKKKGGWGLTIRQGTVLILLGLVLRLGVFALIDYKNSGHDEPDYHALAINLLDHHVFAGARTPNQPTVVRAPLYPAVLAGMLATTHRNEAAVRILQALLSLATCFLLYASVSKFSRTLAVWTLWLSVLCPYEAFLAGRLMPEPLCTLLLVCAFAAPVLISGALGWLLCGVAFGAAALARDIYLLLPLCASIAVLFGVSPVVLASRLKAVGLIVLGVIVTVGPWTMRNYKVTHQFVPVSQGYMWMNLWAGTWESPVQGWSGNIAIAPLPPYLSALEKHVAESSFRAPTDIREQHFKSLALTRIRTEPLRIIGRWIARYPLLWISPRCPFLFQSSYLAHGTLGFYLVKGLLAALDILMLLLGIAGIAAAILYEPKLLWYAVPIIYTACIYLPFHNTESRYSQPVFLFLIVFIAVSTRMILVYFKRELSAQVAVSGKQAA